MAGRRINDRMGAYVADQLIRAMLRRRLPVNGGRVLIMGLTFKENCPDLRNTRVVDIVTELAAVGCEVDIHDPWVQSRAELPHHSLVEEPLPDTYEAVVVAVAHEQFRQIPITYLRSALKPGGIIYDLKGVFPPDQVDLKL